MATIHPQAVPSNVQVQVSKPATTTTVTGSNNNEPTLLNTTPGAAPSTTTTTTTVTTSIPTIASSTESTTVATEATATPSTTAATGVKAKAEDIVEQVKQALGNAQSRVSTAVHSLPASASAITESTKATAHSALDSTKIRFENVVHALPHPHLPTTDSLPSASEAVASVQAHLPSGESLPRPAEVIASAKSRLNEWSASLPDTQSVKTHLQEMTAALPSRDAFAHPAETVAAARARLPSIEQLQPTQAIQNVTTRLNETKDRLICTLDENPTVQKVKMEINTAKTRIASNPQVIAMVHRVEVAKDQVLAKVLKDNDPKHTKEIVHILGQSWAGMTTWFGKAMFLLVALAHFFILGLPDIIFHKLGLRNNNKFRLRRVVTSPKVWVGEYIMPVASSNCVVFQGIDDTLLIRSPPEPTPAIVQAIREEGEPAAFLVSLSHDTWVDKWKELFPSALVICPKADVASVDNRCKVDLTLEDAAEYLRTNFRVVQTINTNDWSRTEDYVLILELEPGKLAASLGCGFCNVPPKITSPVFWRNLMLGLQGLGVKSPYAYFFVKDQAKQQEMWNTLRNMKGLDTLLFLHGEPIVAKREGEMQQIMDLAHLKRMGM